MKRSEITITMPLTAFEELEAYKNKYAELIKNIQGCFDTGLYDINAQTTIEFDANKALNLAKQYLSEIYRGKEVSICV